MGQSTDHRDHEPHLKDESGAVEEDVYTHRITVERPISFVPQRVVSLVPSLTESLFDLDLGERLIAVTDYCIRPEAGVARLPKVGGTKNPDIPRIIGLKPDLVILNREENRKPDADALEAAGIEVWVTEPNTVREALDLLWLIMDVFEHPKMVHRVRNIEITYEQTLRYMTTDTALLRTFVPIWRDPWMSFNEQTYIHDLLYSCGALNIFAQRERQFPLKADLGQDSPLTKDDPRVEGRDTRYPRISLEEVIAAQPELILLPDEPYPFGERDKDEIVQLLAGTPAVKSNQVYVVDGSYLTWHGTRLAYALNELPPLVAAARDANRNPDHKVSAE